MTMSSELLNALAKVLKGAAAAVAIVAADKAGWREPMLSIRCDDSILIADCA